MGSKPNIVASAGISRIRLVCGALFCALLSLGSVDALAVNITIAANTNWSAITTGSGPGGQPSAADNITVNATLTANVTNGTCATLVLGNTANGTLTFSAATSSVTVASTVTLGNGGRTGSINMTNGGTLTLDGFVLNSLGTWTQGAGTVVFTANNTLPNNNNFDTFNNVVVSAGTTTLGKSTTIDGDLTVNAGATLAPGGNATSVAGDFIVNGTINGTAAFTLSGSGTNIDGTGSITDTGTVTLGTGNKTILSTANLSFSGTVAINGARTITNNGSITVVGNLTGSAAGSTWVNAANSTLNAQGTLLTTGTLTANAAGNTVIYADTATQVVKQPSAGYFNLSLAGTGSKTMPAGTMTVGGDLSIGAGVTYNGTTNNPVINLAGDFTNGGTFNSGTGVFTFNGSAGQNITGTTTFTNMAVNDAGGITLANNVTVGTTATGTLTFTNGLITTGANNIIVASGATIAGPSAASYVVGNFQKTYAAAANLSFFAGNDFPVGDASNFTPVAITAGTTTTAGSLIVSTLTPDHPQVLVPIASTGIDATQSVNRYWRFANSGITVGTAISATFTFVTSDVDAGANTAAFMVQRYDGTNWNPTTLVAANPLNTQVSNVTPLATGNNDFAIGQPLSGVTSVPGAYETFETTTPAAAILGKIQTKIAGTPFSVDIVHLNVGKTAQLAGAITVEVRLLNSSSGGALDANGCNAGWPLIQAAPNFAIPASGRGTIPAVTVANVFRDVRFQVRSPVGGPYTLIGCSTDRFAIRPASLTVSAQDTNWTTAGAVRTLANSGATGGNVHAAGQPFTLQAVAQPVTATNYDGSPTPVVGNPVCVTPPASCTNTNGALTFGAWSAAGTATISSTASYTEAGVFTLQLEDKTYASVDAVDGSSTATMTVPATATTTVGRFVPDHFVVSTALPVPQFQTFGSSCATRSFTYIGQKFGYATPYQATVTAQNAAGATTTNYKGTGTNGLWKVAGSGITETYSNNSVGPALITTAIGIPTVADNGDGTGTVTPQTSSSLTYTRSTTAPIPASSNPFTADISLVVSAQDASESATTGNGTITTSTPATFNGSGGGMAFDAGASFRFGRLQLSNALGSEKLDLPVGTQTQYWTGSGFINNIDDQCTSITTGNVSLVPNYQGGLSTTNMGASHISISGNFGNGAGNLKLTRPSPTASGSVDLKVNLGAGNFSYLQGNWGAVTFDQDPTARANFGLYGSAPSNFLYFRENY